MDTETTPLYLSWMGAILGSALVGVSGLLPMMIIPLDAGPSLRSEKGSSSLRLLLSFAVGGLLGDVFLHLFPESYGALASSGRNTHTGHLVMGIWILGEYHNCTMNRMCRQNCAFSFVHRFHKCMHGCVTQHNETLVKVIFIFLGGILTFLILEKIFEASEDNESQNNNKGDESKKKIIGYLNLAANCIDNFIHGLAVASR